MPVRVDKRERGEGEGEGDRQTGKQTDRQTDRQTRPRFILSSERVLGGMEFEPMLTPRENPLYRKISLEEDRTRDVVDSEPKHYQ